MTPTQAQIEAAVDLVERLRTIDVDPEANDILNEAAAEIERLREQVGQKGPSDWLGMAEIIKQQTAELERLRQLAESNHEIIWELQQEIAEVGHK